VRIEEIENVIKEKVGKGVITSEIRKRKVVGKERKSLWMRIKKESLKDVIKVLFDFQYPHLSVISGSDLGDKVELLYHFTLGYGEPQKEQLITFAVQLDKKDLTIPTITDLIPGALLTEREKQEFFGIKVIGIPDSRRAFLADDLKNAHPWIRDDKETARIAKDVHAKEVKK